MRIRNHELQHFSLFLRIIKPILGKYNNRFAKMCNCDLLHVWIYTYKEFTLVQNTDETKYLSSMYLSIYVHLSILSLSQCNCTDVGENEPCELNSQSECMWPGRVCLITMHSQTKPLLN